MSHFTLDQKKAHDPWRHISITANAGSGKTRVLVSRYCDIVEGAVRGVRVLPDQIAAITFTEKAASELRGKIAAEIERRLDSEDHRANWSRLKAARENFTSAIVSTIHGFCSQLLREFPIETGVSPNFAVTSGYERRQATEDALMEAIEEALDEKGAHEPETYALALRIGREKMETVLRMMISSREIIWYSRTRGGVLTLGREETLERWRAQLDSVTRGLVLNATTLPAITAIIAPMKEAKSSEAEEALAELRRARGADEILPRISELQRLLLTKEHGIRRSSYPKDENLEILSPQIDTLDTAFKRAEKFLMADADPLLHAELYDDSRLLLGIYDDAIRRYEGRKARGNALDFEDLQIRLLEAIANPETRTTVGERFRYIMIDEFQDTNELQYAIAYDLLNSLADGRLTVVGDRKQSIYGFRNAEVAVFQKATDEIKRANREMNREVAPLFFREERIEPESRDEMLGEIKLAASFRLLPSICAYVNEVCEPLLQSSALSGFGVEYEPLVCARRSEGRGSVEFIISDPEPDSETRSAPPDFPSPQEDTGGLQTNETPSAPPESPSPQAERGGLQTGERSCDPVWCPESEMIARRILDLVAANETIWECPEGSEQEVPRPIRFSDFAILSRKRVHFPALESAFRKYGVPFVTHGGVGFYKTQEIYDILNYLRVLLNSRDDVATLGVLRSPFFCVSDAELYRISIIAGSEGTDLWSRAVRRIEQGDAEPALERAVRMISEDHSMAGRLPISLLMRRLIERTGWRGATIGSERGEQNLANIDKLLEMAREYESRGFTNLFDFVERINEMVELDEMEGEAPVNTGRDAVRLMTMHAAKGLEFPIVIIPSLHSPPRPSVEPFFDKDLGFGWNWRFNKDERRPAIVALMGMRSTERDRAEEARLFYVALTRARDRLIICGEYDRKKPPADTMLGWALRSFEEVPEQNSTLKLDTAELRFLAPDGTREYGESWSQELPFHLHIDERARYDRSEPLVLPFREDMVQIGELRARAEGEIYSATQYMVYNQCPTKYYLKYRLGIPEELGAAYAIDPDARDTEDGTVFARLFRRVAPKLDLMLSPGFDEEGEPIQQREIDRAVMERTINEVLVLEPQTIEEGEQMQGRLIETFEGLLSSPQASSVLVPIGSASRVDYELSIPFQKEYLLGVIDRVIGLEDGTLSFVQYKTRRIGAGELRRVAESYLPQLRVYAYLISLLAPAQRSVVGTVLFTEHPDAPQSFTFTKFEMMRIEEELRAVIEDIRALSYSGRRTLPLRTPHCPDCPYFIEGACLLGPRGER